MNGDSITYDSIQNILGRARTDYDSRRLSEDETNMAKAAGMYCNALYSTKRSWRSTNVYGGFIWIYLTVFLLSAVFALYYFKVDTVILDKFGISPSNSLYAVYFNGIIAVT